MLAEFHLAEKAFALHLLLQRPEGLIDIVVADENLHVVFLFNPTVDDRPTTKAPRPLRTDIRKRCRYPIKTLSILSLYSIRSFTANEKVGPRNKPPQRRSDRFCQFGF
jgi:hypothetical protein